MKAKEIILSKKLIKNGMNRFNAIKLAKMFDNNNFSEFNVCEFMNRTSLKTTSSLVNRKHIFSISVNGILVKKLIIHFKNNSYFIWIY